MAFDLMNLQNSPFGEFALPFVFIFAVVYGVLLTTSTIKDKRANLIVALAIALFASLYQPLNLLLWQYMPYAAGILLVLFFIKLVLNLLGVGKPKGEGVENNKMIGLVILILLVVVVGSLSQLRYIESSNIVWVIGLVIFAAILIIVSQMKEKKEDSSQ